jgi:glyoxylase-like metal-dependent hydrolase (beta-lactamase superfamily II)
MFAIQITKLTHTVMLNVVFFTFNVFEENTYLLINEQKECWIVDPGMYEVEEWEQLHQYIEKEGLKPQAIINTHAHLDHIFGVQRLIDAYNRPFGIHEKEVSVLQMGPMSASMYGFHMPNAPKATFFIPDGVPLQLGNDTLEVRFTPGHTTGSISFYYAKGNWVLGGDVLFAGGIGRTDLPGGNMDTLLHSIRHQLFTLPGHTKVLSGHGPATTIDAEMKYNPLVNAR